MQCMLGINMVFWLNMCHKRPELTSSTAPALLQTLCVSSTPSLSPCWALTVYIMLLPGKSCTYALCHAHYDPVFTGGLSKHQPLIPMDCVNLTAMSWYGKIFSLLYTAMVTEGWDNLSKVTDHIGGRNRSSLYTAPSRPTYCSLQLLDTLYIGCRMQELANSRGIRLARRYSIN